MGQYTNTYTASHAVVVGIDDYKDDSFQPLGEAEADARAVADLLADEPYSFFVRTLFGEEATKAAVIGALGKLSADTQPDDRIVFYFAGHGYTRPNKLGVEVGYLACSDTVPSNPYAGLKFAEVTELCEWAKAKHIAFILDACFSGKALGLTRGISGAAVDKYLTRRAWQVLTAGGDEVVADAHSMTDILVRALREGIPGESGPLTFSGVGNFVKDEMAARTHGTQIPVCQYLRGSSNGEMILFALSPFDALPGRLRRGLSSEDADTRYFALDGAAQLLNDPDCGTALREVLEKMVIEDPDAAVRRRVFEVLSGLPAPVPGPAVEVVTPEPGPDDVEPESLGVENGEAVLPVEDAEHLPTAPREHRGLPAWAWVGGAVVGVALLAGALALAGVFGPRAAPTPEPTPLATTQTPPPTATEVAAVIEETTQEPTASPIPTEPPTQEPTLTVGQLAEGSVTHNADWTPYIEEKNGVEMALVPAGCFRMGSDNGNSDEVPIHEVCFEEPFWIDVYEVTNEQSGSVGCADYSSEPEQPRNCVSWADALAHCEVRGVRLPTEAEWEYAARGPDGLVYPWGNDFFADYVVYSGNSGEQTANVGSRPGGASWVGAFDLSGNVYEWINDWYDANYYVTLAEGAVNPQGAGIGEYRVLRGGSWHRSNTYFLRAASRGRLNPISEDFSIGFRCALSY